MSQQPDRSPELPRLLIVGTPKDSKYFIARGEGSRADISTSTFRLINTLNSKAPDLVYVTDNLIPQENISNYFIYTQRLAETMHRLSQPDQLGDILQPESHGVHIVGYRLTQALEVVDRRQFPVPEPKPEPERPWWQRLSAFA